MVDFLKLLENLEILSTIIDDFFSDYVFEDLEANFRCFLPKNHLLPWAVDTEVYVLVLLPWFLDFRKL